VVARASNRMLFESLINTKACAEKCMYKGVGDLTNLMPGADKERQRHPGTLNLVNMLAKIQAFYCIYR
jgi:hypothetical protein